MLGSKGTPKRKSTKSKLSKYFSSPHKNEDVLSEAGSSPLIFHPHKGITTNMDLKREYCRYCKLHSSEPLELVASPLEKATICQEATTCDGGVSVNMAGRGLRGVDCIALGKIIGSNANINHLNLNDCLLFPQGFEALLDGISKNTNIETLELNGNNIHSASMLRPLGSMLKVNCKLKRLVLEWNHIGVTTENNAYQTFCDGLSINTGIEHLDLRNNQFPTRSQQQDMVKDYSTRTIILTKQLQKTEEEYQTEIKNVISIFDADEKKYRGMIEENQNQINRLAQERQDEISKNEFLRDEIKKLNRQLSDANGERAKLADQLGKMEQRVAEIEFTFNSQTASLEQNFDKKLRELQVLTDSLSKEKSSLTTKLRTAEVDLQMRTGEMVQLKETIISLNKSSEQLKQQFDGNLFGALSSPPGKGVVDSFPAEIESAERKEIQRLECQMTEMNSSLMEHLKVLENKKADAEDEVRRLKTLLVTSKSETEEELTKLRVNLAEGHNNSVKTHLDQISNLRKDTDRLESEINKLEGQVRKLEGDNGKLSRQNEHLKQQVNQVNEDINEIHLSSQNSMVKTKNELKDSSERLIKEEEANRKLRSELIDFQQQVSSLSVKLTKLSQEKQADMDFWKLQIQRRDDELSRIKSEDMRRATLLHEAFSVYMKSTAHATGLPIPGPLTSCYQDLQPNNSNPTVTPLNQSQTNLNVGEQVQSVEPGKPEYLRL